MTKGENARGHEKWAHFRFGVVGRLLAAPPPPGELEEEIETLSKKTWQHPIQQKPAHFAFSTIERWYYRARREKRDPVGALEKRRRSDSGQERAMSVKLSEVLAKQYKAHRGWSYQLHHDNLVAEAEKDPGLGEVPAYHTVRRSMQAHGLVRQKRRVPRPLTSGEQAAEERLSCREVRSFEVEDNQGLWHLDYHHGSRRILTAGGKWATPLLLGVLDDRSRLCCHAQWYLTETAEDLVHGLCQAILKRGLPRALMTDNGSAMTAAEVTQGLLRLGIHHETTLPYSPHQNGKQENFWCQIEGRLLPMMEGCREVTLAFLNQATQAFVEREYHRTVHSETGQPPLARWLDGPHVGREAPTPEALRLAFTAEVTRTQRRSDGTISLSGKRLEIPSRYRHMSRVCVRYAEWDLSAVTLVDPESGVLLCPLFPLDRNKNADARRRVLEKDPSEPNVPDGKDGRIAPLLEKLLADYAATGLPPAFLPKTDKGGPE